MPLCSVKNCPAETSRGYKTCAPHRQGRTAEDLGLLLGEHGEHCLLCKRAFKADDFVRVESVATTRRRKAARGHVHVACEPTRPRPSKIGTRAAIKPLLADL